MVEGAVQKYLKEVTLTSQPFVKDSTITVEQYLRTGARVLAVDLQLGGEEWILVRSGVKILSVLALLVQTYKY